MSAVHPIEHPCQMGPQNKHILDTLTSAYRAALHLAEEGFTVLDVRIGTRNPRVFIQNCGRCRKLRGTSAAVRVGPQGREHVMVANVHGAQVEWIVRGN